MKKILISLSVLATVTYAQIVTIIDNGIERKIFLDTNKNSARSIIKNSSIIISFKKDNINLDKFAKKYNLKLKKVISTKSKYYIFINKSKYKDIKLIKLISKENKNIIKTIRPNWGLGMIPR